jgi:hypothetical protein
MMAIRFCNCSPPPRSHTVHVDSFAVQRVRLHTSTSPTYARTKI